jgi:type II secretory pathway predicted ATPase ExeA
VSVRKLRSRYGLTKTPFTKEVPTDELYEHPGVERAIAQIKAALAGRSSCVLTGEAGTGKTFGWRAVEASLPSGTSRVTYIHNSTVNLRDFYRQLGSALGLEAKATPSALFRTITSHVEEIAAQKIRPVIVIDEAHLLPLPVLGHLHILLNYQRDSRSLLSLVLLGLPGLRDRLRRNALSSLGARLPMRIHLEPLTVEQVGEYLRHRMSMAGCSQEVFAEDAVLLVAEATGGVMRKIDVLASRTLDVACEGKSKLVDASVVGTAAELCAEALV